MASVRCDFQPQSVWSVFACVAKKMRAVAKNNTDRTKKSIFRAVGVECILRWNSTLKPCIQTRSPKTRVCPSGLLRHLTPLMSPRRKRRAAIAVLPPSPPSSPPPSPPWGRHCRCQLTGYSRLTDYEAIPSPWWRWRWRWR